MNDNSLIQCFTGWSFDPMSTLLWVLLIVFVLMLWRMHRTGIDFGRLIIGDDGQLSWTKMLGCTGGVVFTWGFIFLIRHDRISEWYFNGYGFICFGTAFVYKRQAMRSPVSPQQTVTVSAPSDAQVNVATGAQTS